MSLKKLLRNQFENTTLENYNHTLLDFVYKENGIFTGYMFCSTFNVLCIVILDTNLLFNFNLFIKYVDFVYLISFDFVWEYKYIDELNF